MRRLGELADGVSAKLEVKHHSQATAKTASDLIASDVTAGSRANNGVGWLWCMRAKLVLFEPPGHAPGRR
jgi:hypothetical protein